VRGSEVKRERIETTQARLEHITRRWWFFGLIALMQIVPPYASRGVRPEESGLFIGEILSNCYLYEIPVLHPIFKILPLVLVLLLILLGNRVARVFSIYVAINYVLVAVLQSVGVSEMFGFGVILGNLIMFLLVAAVWGWEAMVSRNDLSLRDVPLWKYWVVPLAFVAFWYPVNPITWLPDFRPVLFFTNEAGLTFCMMTPVYLAILTLIHPRVNYVTLRVHSLIGIIIGLYNVLVNFVLDPAELWWNGILHIPLISISIYAFILSFRLGLRGRETAG
jgi:hypothetical protein